jgi:hypothetical protein
MITHWRNRDQFKTLCGRYMNRSRTHKDWPICKSCERIRLAKGLSYQVWFDADGWSIPGSTFNTTYKNTNGIFYSTWAMS